MSFLLSWITSGSPIIASNLYLNSSSDWNFRSSKSYRSSMPRMFCLHSSRFAWEQTFSRTFCWRVFIAATTSATVMVVLPSISDKSRISFYSSCSLTFSLSSLTVLLSSMSEAWVAEWSNFTDLIWSFAYLSFLSNKFIICAVVLSFPSQISSNFYAFSVAKYLLPDLAEPPDLIDAYERSLAI